MRRKKSEEPVTDVTPTPIESTEVEAPKRTRRKAVSADASEVVKTPTSRAKKKVQEPPVETAAPAPETVAKPRRATKAVRTSKVPKGADASLDLDDELVPTFRKAKGRPAPTPKGDEDYDDLSVSFRSVEKRSAKKEGPLTTTKRAKVATPEVAAAVPDTVIDWDTDLPVPSFRAKGTSAPISSDEDAPARTDRGRRRRRGGRQESSGAELANSEEIPTFELDEEDEPQALFRSKGTTPKATPVEPEPVKKPGIPIPPSAPQIVLRDGIPTLVRDGRVYPPIFFFASAPDERRTQIVLGEAKMAADAGIHVHSLQVDLMVDDAAVPDAAKFANQYLARLLEVDPEAQIVYRVSFRPEHGWQSRYPKARYLNAGGYVAEPSVCDDSYWGTAKTALQEFVRQIRKGVNSGSVMGVHLDRGEWFFPADSGYDTSEAAREKFRQWARTRYQGDEVALRANWFDGGINFNNIEIPLESPHAPEGEQFVRSSRKQRRYVDYHLFLSDETVSRITDLAYAVKEASDGTLIVGASYGYTFEWSHPASGHLSLGKLLRAQEVDYISGPPSYKNREPGGTAPFPGPIDSFALNGKLFISEEDFKTSLSVGQEPDDYNLPLRTPQALDSVHWRGTGAALAHQSGVSWMDLFGNGWLQSPSIWERAQQVRSALTMRMAVPPQDPDVIVFIDERALAYLVDPNAFHLLVQNVRESVLRAGMSAGFYLLSDLAHREKFPEAKLYLFLNAWDIRPELRAAIKGRLQRDHKVLFWLYSAGLFDAGRESLERARECTGIALKPQPFHSKSGTTLLNRRHPLCEAFPDATLDSVTQLEPSYFAIPEDAAVLGEYSQTGLPSFVVKRNDGDGDRSMEWTSVFLGEPVVNPQLIRALGQMAGAHQWSHTEDLVHVRAPFLTVHCAGAGPRDITLPANWSAFNLATQAWISLEATQLRFMAMDGSTHCFLVGVREEVEHWLNFDPDVLLKIAELPPKELNVLTDSSNFDVPIMKLGEFIETGDGDEAADDWFLRAPIIAESEPRPSAQTEEASGRRRRRRRGGGQRGGSGSEESADRRYEPFSAPDIVDEDLGMGVVFRRRD
jgi:hypothetical protein